MDAHEVKKWVHCPVAEQQCGNCSRHKSRRHHLPGNSSVFSEGIIKHPENGKAAKMQRQITLQRRVYYNDYNVEANTISISEGGNSCGYIQFNPSPFWSGGHCYTIQKIADNVDNLYLYHYLKSQEDAIMKLRIGSGLPNIQKKDLAMFKIKIPAVEQQRTISTFLSSLERKAETEEMLLNAMKKEKQYLLRQMFI